MSAPMWCRSRVGTSRDHRRRRVALACCIYQPICRGEFGIVDGNRLSPSRPSIACMFCLNQIVNDHHRRPVKVCLLHDDLQRCVGAPARRPLLLTSKANIIVSALEMHAPDPLAVPDQCKIHIAATTTSNCNVHITAWSPP